MVQSAELNSYMTTFSLSRGGCGLAWSGPRPRHGTILTVRLGGGRTAASLRAMVCWERQLNKIAMHVGVRFIAGDDAKLAALLAGACARSGDD